MYIYVPCLTSAHNICIRKLFKSRKIVQAYTLYICFRMSLKNA